MGFKFVHLLSPRITINTRGLKIRIRFEIRRPHNEVTDSNLKKYKQLVKEYYTKPVNRKNNNATNRILKDIEIDHEWS